MSRCGAALVACAHVARTGALHMVANRARILLQQALHGCNLRRASRHIRVILAVLLHCLVGSTGEALDGERHAARRCEAVLHLVVALAVRILRWVRRWARESLVPRCLGARAALVACAHVA